MFHSSGHYPLFFLPPLATPPQVLHTFNAHTKEVDLGRSLTPPLPRPLPPSLFCPPPPPQVLRTFNAHTKKLDLGHTLTDYFEEQAAQRPHHPCLLFEGAALTYTEVDAEANMVGHFLQRRWVCLCLCVWRGEECNGGGREGGRSGGCV